MANRKKPEAPRDAPARPGLASHVAARSLVVALAAAALTYFFFAPRFVLFPALETEDARYIPEVGRATDVLRLVADPWTPLPADSIHKVTEWRLFFPVIWHYLGLPRWLLFAVPYVGCALALWLATWLTYARLGNWWQTWMAATLFAALPWFFVSTGWLLFFDSFVTLSQLVVAFVPARWALALACLLTPWIDERFVIALPVCLAVRAVALGYIQGREWRKLAIDVAVVAVASFPYPAIRAAVWLQGDPNSTAYVSVHREGVRKVPLLPRLFGKRPEPFVTSFTEGLWSGYRAAWVFVAAGVWFTARRLGWAWGAVLGGIAATTVVVGLVIAADMSRMMMMVCPTLLLGVWMWRQMRPAGFERALTVVLVANFLLPAAIVVWDLRVPVVYLHAQIAQLNSPPFFLTAEGLTERANQRAAKGEIERATSDYDRAIALDPAYVLAYANRGIMRGRTGDSEGALEDLNEAVRLSPNMSDARLVRAKLLLARGQVQPAIADLRAAVQFADAKWPQRAEAERLLEQATKPPP
ncbi:MAG: hypothetical protein HYX69_23365 [Planctomycetia bacterium]|nr:hypothetical protein [Planctomycetia bacterium]